MYSKFQLARKYFQYYLTASNGKGHGIHSPFVFEFVTRVLNDKYKFDAYDLVESLRRKLEQDMTVIDVEDLGAGSAKSNAPKRIVSNIAIHSAKSRKLGQLLFRVANYYKPKNILELGTSLGISSAYMAIANPDAHVLTAEGSRSLADIARSNFQHLHLNNIKVVEGNFENSLSTMLEKLPTIDLAFIDGNHRKEPTLSYFKRLVSKATPKTIFIFDDIHWSREMEDAWKIIQDHPDVTCTIDIFFMGFVFFRSELKTKRHFTIRF